MLGCALVAVGCGRGKDLAPQPLPALANSVTLVRIPHAGGEPALYHPDSLTPFSWTSSAKLPPIRRVLGLDIDERTVYVGDEGGNVIGLDLGSGKARTYLTKVRLASVMADGSVYAIDSARTVTHLVRRSPVKYRTQLPGNARFLYGSLPDEAVAITSGSPPKLVTLGPVETPESLDLPEGEVASTVWGDLVAVAREGAVTVYDTHGKEESWTGKFSGKPIGLGFSPSGHRLYVARERGDILSFDRFAKSQIGSVNLPGAVRAIRPDPSGRWMLARPAQGDSVWVVDLTTNRVTHTVRSTWEATIPMVAGASTLLVHQRGEIVALDLTKTPAVVTGRVASEEDLWIAVPWVPKERATIAIAAAESALVRQDSALVSDTTRGKTAAAELQIYLQVSSSQNEDWATELAKQLKTAGFPALVRKPASADEGFRVIVGPFQAREEAEDAGRKLGRPYFILTTRSEPER